MQPNTTSERREIKFRAWNKRASGWFDETRFANKFQGRSDIYRLKMFFSRLNHFKDVELMQYTGLKDKNGREIYEGDYVNYFRGRGEILWREAGWQIFNHEKGWHERLLDMSTFNPGDFFVIGNIYENSNLLP